MRTSSLALVALALVACSPTLPPAPAHAFARPSIEPHALQACWLEYATNTQPGAYGTAGESDELHWDVTFSGLLLRHAAGDVLLDVGNSTHFDDEIATSGFFARQLQKNIQGAGERVATAPEALARAGEPIDLLKAIIVSHVHADHAGGVMDLPGTAVALSADELAFATREKDKGGFAVVRAQAESIAARAKPIVFAKTPYETFDESYDYYGDGSIVMVPLYGHTPGSIGTFVNLSPGERYFHVGDASNTLEAILKRRGKSVFLSFTDSDGDRADAIAAKLTQLHDLDPGLVLIPAHDRKAWQRAFGTPGQCRGARPSPPRP